MFFKKVRIVNDFGLSSPPHTPSDVDITFLLSSLVLFVTFQEEAAKQREREEAERRRLQNEIQQLQQAISRNDDCILL